MLNPGVGHQSMRVLSLISLLRYLSILGIRDPRQKDPHMQMPRSFMGSLRQSSLGKRVVGSEVRINKCYFGSRIRLTATPIMRFID